MLVLLLFYLRNVLLNQRVPRRWWSIQRCLILYFWACKEFSRIKISALSCYISLTPAVRILTASKHNMGNTIFRPLKNLTILSSQVIHNLHNGIDLHSCLNLLLAFCPSQQLESCSNFLCITQWTPQRIRNMCHICQAKFQWMKRRQTDSVGCSRLLHLPQRLILSFAILSEARIICGNPPKTSNFLVSELYFQGQFRFLELSCQVVYNRNWKFSITAAFPE